MKKTIISTAVLAAFIFASCQKQEPERTYQCTITQYEIEAIAAPSSVIVPFTGTYSQMKKFEADRTFGIPGVTDSQECHCR